MHVFRKIIEFQGCDYSVEVVTSLSSKAVKDVAYTFNDDEDEQVVIQATAAKTSKP